MPDPPAYEVAVVGGGPAGLTAALYATRLGHRTALFERVGGRHAKVDNVHNLLGVSEDVSGSELAELGVRQLEEYGADYFPDSVDAVERAADDERFRLDAAYGTVAAERVVFATGFSDVRCEVPGLERFTGRGLHYCLHCDAYTLGDGSVFVLGHDDHAAMVAMTLLHVTDDVTLLTNDSEPEWSDETGRQLAAHPVERVDAAVVGAFAEEEPEPTERGRGDREFPGDQWLGGLEFADGTEREFLGGFAVYGKDYNSELAASLGCELTDEGAIAVDEDGRTSVDGAYAVGDVTHGQNQTPVALGDGARAGIAIHKDLRRFPIDPDELPDDADSEGIGAAETDATVPGAAPELRARMRRDRHRTSHAGLREPRPEE